MPDALTPEASGLSSARPRLPLSTPSAPGDGPTYRRLAVFAGAVLRLMSREEWDAASQLPATGGVLVVSNHVTYVDPVALGKYLIWSGRWPRYLGKASLWRVPIIGWLARRCHQIPVQRGTDRAKDALVHARVALEQGECVAIFPEGGRTRDPGFLPGRGRTGAARLALATGVPVLPTAHWGTHAILPPRRVTLPRLWARHRIQVVMGDPVDLSDLAGRADDPDAVREASDRIIASVTLLVDELRRADAVDPQQL